jgi:predicted permease
MTTIRRFLLRLASFFRIGRAESELAREINSHLQLLEDEFAAAGMPRDEARLAARRAFGGVEQAKEHQRDARGFRWLDDSRIDFKLGARMLVKYPGVSLVGGAGLAVAIAICASFFAFTHAYLYSTLPIDEADRVVALENWDLAVNNEERRQVHDFIAWREAMRTVKDISAFRVVNRNLIGPGGSSEPIQVAEMTPSAFQLTRVPPLLGRPLAETDTTPGARPVAVIGHDEWQSRFAADPAIVGRDLRLGNMAYTIVGVMPQGYAFPFNQGYWVPFRADPTGIERRQGPSIFIFGRLVPGATMAMAQAELSTIGTRMAAEFPGTHAQLQPRVMPYTYPVLDIQDILLWEMTLFQLMVSLLLVIVAGNVAILVYARTATRRGEIAVRTALGASRRRIVGQLFIEALVLSAGAAAVGLLLARIGLAQAHAIMRAEGGSLPYWIDLGIPPAALAYVLALTLVAAIIAGVLPALQATGRQVQSTLRELGGHAGGRLGGTWTALIVAQVGMAVALLPMAVTLFGWHQISQSATTPTFEPEPYLAAFLSIDPEPPLGVDRDVYTKDRDARFDKLRTDLAATLEAERDVAGVTAALASPGDEPSARIAMEGATAGGASLVKAGHVAINYFDLFDARILSGRAFTTSDTNSASHPVIVNRSFVQHTLEGGPAIGRRFRYAEPDRAHPSSVDPETWHEIVGVVSDLETNALDPTLVTPTVFHPLVGDGVRALFLVRAPNGGAAFAGRLREIAIKLDPTVRVLTVTFADLQRQSRMATRLVLLVLVLLIASVLLLSAAGIYALMSFTVTQRRKEIGIRAAMGADSRQLLLGIFTRSVAQLAAGVVVGVIAAVLIDTASSGEALGRVGYVLLPAMALIMMVVGLIASIGPARRGLRIQPTEALRAE